jgi:hypothetical protein
VSKTRRRNPNREQFWRDTLAAWRDSGQSVRAFCAARGLSEGTFYVRRRELADNGQWPMAAASPPSVLILACAGVLAPLYRLMCERVLLSAALHADDTPIALLAPRRTAHAWVYVGDAANPYSVFDLSVGRSRDAPAAFLKGYKGFVHADGYAGYNPVYGGGATHVGCWMHARRSFFDARLSDPERAHEALARIRALYALERDAKARELTGAALPAYRQEHAGPVLASFAAWLADQRPRVLPKPPIGEAVTYATNQWPALVVYLTERAADD